MKTINLLPKEVRVKDIRSVILNAASMLLIIVIIILVAISVFMFDINKNLVPKLDDYENINRNINNYITQLEEYEKLKNKVNAKSGLINLLKKDKDLSLSKIGQKIQETIEKQGFSPITNLSGHGLLQYEIHSPPTIPNYANGNHLTHLLA